MDNPKILATGTKVFDGAESWIDWILLDGIHDREDISDFLQDHNFCYSYSYPGGSFQNSPTFRHSGNRTLVKQYCGYDI